MGKWQNGPDMTDILIYLAQMDQQGGWFSSVLLMPTGSPAAPHVIFNVMSTKSKAPTLEGSGILTVYDGWPSKEHASFSGAFYRCLIEHDTRLSSETFLDGLT